jgi:hypothetical protein
MPMQSTIKLKYNNVKDGLSEADMYMLSECELIDIGNINLPSQNMKFFGEFSETNIIKIPEFLIDNIFGGFTLSYPALSISRCRSRYEADLSVYVISFISNSKG